MHKLYGIVFKSNGKVYNFVSQEEIEVNTKVIVDTDKGLQIATVIKQGKQVDNLNKYKFILRVASEKDLSIHNSNLEAAERALKQARELVDELGLEMRLIDASYTFDKKQLLFNFLANERVDFRELVKKLAGIYHTRIELRQIGVRDKAREVCGVGQCGRKLCCCSFLDSIETVTINMAKNQNIALNPNKINGACGRLLCCLTYEDDQYQECRKNLPQLGEIINSEHGKGKVESIDIMAQKATINVNNERFIVDYNKSKKEKRKK